MNEKQKYILLDVTGDRCARLLLAPLREVQLHARIIRAANPEVRLMAPPVTDFGLAKLTEAQLHGLIRSMGFSPAGAYNEVIYQILRLLQTAKCHPATYEELLADVEARGLPELGAEMPFRLEDDTPAPKPRAEKPAKAAKEPKAKRAPSAPGARPSPESTTGKVWVLADELQGKLGRLPTSKEVVAACEAAGISKGTASVQYGKWKGSQK